MKDSELLALAWRWACCKLGNHRLFVVGRCGLVTDHIACRDCRRQWGMNHDVRCMLPWSEVRGFHIEHGYNETAALRAHAPQEDSNDQ